MTRVWVTIRFSVEWRNRIFLESRFGDDKNDMHLLTMTQHPYNVINRLFFIVILCVFIESQKTEVGDGVTSLYIALSVYRYCLVMCVPVSDAAKCTGITT